MREPGSYLGTPVQAGGLYKHLEERTGLDLGAARRLVTGAEGVRGNETGTNCYHIIHKGKNLTEVKFQAKNGRGEGKRDLKKDCVSERIWIGIEFPLESGVLLMTSEVYIPRMCQQAKSKTKQKPPKVLITSGITV